MKRLSTVLLGCIAASAAVPAQAQVKDYPTHTITFVVANTAGSATDVLARMIGSKLTERLKWTVIVEDKPGANTQIAAEYVARAPGDGYTLFLTSNTSHAANPALYASLRYDPVKDFTPIIRTGQVPFVVLVNPSLPVHNMAELISYAKANPGKINYAYPVSASQVSAETIRVRAGLNISGVPYTGSPQALNDLMSGQIEMYIVDLVTARPVIASGKARALAVTSATRSKFLPDLPPIADTLPGFDLTSWSGIFGPANIPKPIVDLLAKEITEALMDKDTQASLEKLGFDNYLTKDPAEFAAFENDQLKLWAKLVKDAGIPPIQN